MHSTTGDRSGFDQLLREAVQEPVVLLPKTALQEKRFVIEHLLGSGGMGVVYKATDTERNATVALKMLTSVDASGIYRLKQEFRALADVVHPNLVALHELFCDQDRWFFTMDLVPGSTLFDQPGEGLGVQKMRSMFAQLAVGIQAIHDAGKLHRDLKPTNVMITPEGRVVILDFGLASDQEPGGAGQTIADDSISGTPLYMAPEQAAAKPASASSDWYAFGVMLFEALTGQVPFAGKGHAVLLSKQQQDAPRPSSLRQGIPDDLEQLCLQLLQRDPDMRPGWQQIMQAMGPASERLDSLAPHEEVPFVGRIQELNALHQAFEATDQRLPVAMFVHGVSGVGKTTLVDQFLNGLRQEGKAVVLTGRCYERESVPFKTCDSLIDALSRYLRQIPSERAASLLPRQVHAIAQLFPALQRLDFVKKLRQRHSLPSDPNELRRVAFEALKELLANMAAQEPLVLFVDDLQWSDVDGAKLLSSVLSRPDPPSLLLIGAYRRDEADTSAGLRALRRRIDEFEVAQVREVALGELNGHESQELARDLLPERLHDCAGHIACEARGSPFFITELSRFACTAQQSGERVRLDDAIKRRLALLSDGDREVLEAICISARPIELSLLRLVTNRDDVAAALRRLQGDRLIRKAASGTSGKVRPYHDRIRETVVAAMNEANVKSWHGRLARAIEGSDTPDLMALTEHLLGAGDDLKAGACASRVADHAAEALAFENAARLYRIALKLDPGDRENERKLQTKLGTSLANAGRGAEAAQAFLRAAEGASLEAALELRQEAARQWLFAGRVTEGRQELDNVLRTVGLKLHSKPYASVVDVLVNRTRMRLHGLDFKERAAEELSKKQVLELRACRTAIVGLWVTDVLQAAAFSSRYLRLALESGNIRDVAIALGFEAIYLSAEGTHRRFIVDDYLSRAQQLAERIDDPELQAYTEHAIGMSALGAGEPSRALEPLMSAENLAKKCTRFHPLHNEITMWLGQCYCWLGRWHELLTNWDVWIKDAQERNDLFLLTAQRIWLTGIYRWLAVDRADKARENLSQGVAQWSTQDFETHRFFAAGSESWIDLYNGSYREAYSRLDEHRRLFEWTTRRVQMARVRFVHQLAYAALGLASISQHPRLLLKVAQQQARRLANEKCPLAVPLVPYIRGCVAHLEGDDDSAVRLLGDAVIDFDRIQFKLCAAATNRRLGRLLGGDEGRTLAAKADETMKQEGIVNPERVAAMLAPGFSD